ncbi:MAG: hypothetical protein UU65_C0001G0124 [candidate division CPR2 bacterium GW2011_GWC1_41_48]|uniref:Uncharacterized protein n=1 Tax=candidate division CPR2 bacterium GW2011_GWC1_41_48 TaxID=1618344 RepID=A0A0G0W9P7_UNCC2|nr:MAG: hypothetical protein UT47_C0001G0124 [candidate division CPR2 bacterium GW2011_GWC2_39_35]KKR28581.1 MAG: hypothetical protein UT60_C0017G0010 [candidate division CPR2 bacterium GW2011_GWD2_39_7]KKR29621.1 MAG: hypothetical protein UT59_C0003G0012 [candidate division CPR2 bacterium GW2011_GWD1_39_7]KKS09719.1 MAG: hypothetical protein UU65_C0001G0124 [candidate division CPR2 bacterium GW2011_GWC1_41_48]OGB72838.1 MAG: hypothetical protein A2Y26_02605 [candidate division CPR2 bacterium G
MLKKIITYGISILFVVNANANQANAATAYPTKTIKFFVGQSLNTLNEGQTGSFIFTVSIPDTKPILRSAFIEFSGVSKSAANPQIELSIGGSTVNHELTTISDKPYFIINLDTMENFSNIKDAGDYSYTLDYKILNGSLSLANAFITITYQYSTQNGYPTQGSLTSSTYDMGGASALNTISWDANTLPNNAKIKVQIATSNIESGPWVFLGPDGTKFSFYESSGETIHPRHNNSRYYKYKVVFSTRDPSVTPNINKIKINYSP